MGLPRACGGVSHRPDDKYPQTRVFPAHAGVFLLTAFRSFAGAGLPRACGGVSGLSACGSGACGSSPRMRGCFPRQRGSGRRKGVFPAHAGVFPKLIVRIVGYACLPRACGGVSSSGKQVVGHKLSSPRMRGCFSSKLLDCNAVRVFPAHAGVFPRSGVMSRRMLSLPRACGGVSN